MAASKETLRAAAKSPDQSKWITRAPKDSAISTVRSEEPVSTTTISSTAGRTASRQRGSISSSSFTIMQSVRVSPAAGRAPEAQRSARRARSGSATATGPGRRSTRGARAHPARDLLHVLGHVRQRGVEAARGLEERLGGRQAPELVERDAGVVQQHGLARLLLEDRDEGLGHGEVADGRTAALAARGGEALLHEQATQAVARVAVVRGGRLGEERAVAREVPRAKERVGPGRDLERRGGGGCGRD